MGRVLIAVLVFVTAACGGEEPQSDGRQRGRGRKAAAAIPVKVESVQRSDISKSVLKNTTLEAERWVDVRARRQGQVVRVLREEGDRVREGDMLAELDSDDALLQQTQMEVAYLDAKRNFSRVEKIYKSNLVSEEQYEAAKTQLDRARAQLDEAKLVLSYTRVTAPIDGIVTLRSVEIGNVVSNSQVIYSVADFDLLLARIRVPEKEIGKVAVGQEARISVETESEVDFEGRVKMISPIVDPESGTIKVTVEIPSRKNLLRPGMFASVHIITETRKNVLVIPKKALVLEGEGNQVFVFDRGESGGKAQRKRIKIGFTDSDRLEILSGLGIGDVVITVGQDGLRPGADVRIVGERPQMVATGPPQGRREGGQGGGEWQGRKGEGRGQDLESRGSVHGKRGSGQSSGEAEEGQPGGDGVPGKGGRGGGDVKAMQARMFERFPEVKKIYDERVKKEPDLATDVGKFRAFIGEMREKGIVTFGGRGR